MHPAQEASDVTVVICARDAAPTIARAVQSAVAQGGPVILVDDGSSDGTADVARRHGGDALQVVSPAAHRSLGHARHIGVRAVTTPWLQWLDADDELLPGRGRRLRESAELEGWDAVWDAAELYDGPSGRALQALPMPAFMRAPGAAVRLFERNHVPGPAWPLVRTACARQLDYDSDLPTADDLDFMLRGVADRCRWGFVADCGYRQFAYPQSLSRRRPHQRGWVAEVLRRHDYAAVEARYLDAGWSRLIAAWAMVSMATFREEWTVALQHLDRLEGLPLPALDRVLEPQGPWPFTERWRRAFQRGTLCVLTGANDEAVALLGAADAASPTAEAANNLGVALDRLGRRDDAEAAWHHALARTPRYADARDNLASAVATAITTHPLRRAAARTDYA